MIFSRLLLHSFVVSLSNKVPLDLSPTSGRAGRILSAKIAGEVDSDSPIDFSDKWRPTIVAASVMASMLLLGPPTCSAVSGMVIEGPSNAELVELTLQPGEKILSDTHTLLYMSDGVVFRSEYRGDTLNRFIQGGRLVADTFTNLGGEPAQVAFATQFPSRILPVQLDDQPGNTIVGNVHSFLAAPYSAELDYVRDSLPGVKLFNWLRLEKVSGTGTVYLTGSGNILEKKLGLGEKLKLYPGASVAMTDNMKLEFVQGRTNNVFAASLLEVEGPGTIWIDSAPISRIVDELDRRLPSHS